MIPLERIVSISTPIFDLDAGLRLELLDDGQLADLTRRVTLTPSLDGGMIVDDMGVFDSDRQVTLRAQIDLTTRTRIQNLHTNNPLLHLSTDQGIFSAVSLSPVFASGEVVWTMQLIQKLNTD